METLEQLKKKLTHPSLTVGEAAILNALLLIAEGLNLSKENPAQSQPQEPEKSELPNEPEPESPKKKAGRPRKEDSKRPPQDDLEDF